MTHPMRGAVVVDPTVSAAARGAAGWIAPALQLPLAEADLRNDRRLEEMAASSGTVLLVVGDDGSPSTRRRLSELMCPVMVVPPTSPAASSGPTSVLGLVRRDLAAAAVAAYAATLAAALGVALDIAHAVEPAGETEAADRLLLRSARAVAHTVELKLHSLAPPPEESIPALVVRRQPTLVVAGRGQRSPHRLGSVISTLLDRSRAPLLLVPATGVTARTRAA